MPAMLSALRIRNLALVEELEWSPGPGFIAVTGETGAGKSVILGALKLVLGERADRTLIRSGAEQCSVEAVFDLESTKMLDAWLEEQGIEPCQDGQLILKRVFTAAGANRQFVNCGATTLAVLKELGDRLVDLHGPHDHQSLFSEEKQTDLLDAYAKAEQVRAEYHTHYARLRELEAEKREISLDDASLQRELDLLKYQVNEIEAAALQNGEEEELSARHAVASQSRRLLDLGTQVVQRIEDAEDSVVSRLAETQKLLRELARIDPKTAQHAEAHESAVVALEEMVSSVRSYCDSLDPDPEKLAEMEERLDLIASLKRKYGGSVDSVVEFGANAAERLSKLSARGETLERIDAGIASAEKRMRDAGARLTKLRNAAVLAPAVRERLQELGFKQAGFEVSIRSASAPRPSGLDDVEFVFAPNPGEPERALKAIASSGEISRVMLALKSALAEQDDIPLLVFDEIDANVGGEIAESVGRMMESLGRGHQVLCITHLPQVAARARAQFVVRKEVVGGRTRSFLDPSEGEARITEIARMLGGTSESALAHARALLHAESGKTPPRRKVRA